VRSRPSLYLAPREGVEPPPASKAGALLRRANEAMSSRLCPHATQTRRARLNRCMPAPSAERAGAHMHTRRASACARAHPRWHQVRLALDERPSAPAWMSRPELQEPNKKPGSCGRPGFWGSRDPWSLKASVGWSFPRWCCVTLVSVMARLAQRQHALMSTRSDAQGHLAREGALGVGGEGWAGHDETEWVGGESTNGRIVKSVHASVNPA
jgi:hypothetical protein